MAEHSSSVPVSNSAAAQAFPKTATAQLADHPATTPPTAVLAADSAPRRGKRRRTVALVLSLALAGGALLPAPYIVERPGLQLDTLGQIQTAAGAEPITVVDPGERLRDNTPNTGHLRLLTVSIRGDREHPLSWGALLPAMFDPAQDIVHVDTVYPPEQSVAQVHQESNLMMQHSQRASAAAALRFLGHQVETRVVAVETAPESDAAQKIQPEDVILSLNGTPVTDTAQVIDLVQQAAGAAVQIKVLRAGQELTVPVQTTWNPQLERFQAGIIISTDATLPEELNYAATEIGGPSAGLVFALALVDKMLAEDLAAGVDVSVTGTIDGAGAVGPIGGLKQKLYAAAAAGSELMIFPAENCEMLPQRVPEQLHLVAVSSLEDAVAAIRSYKAGQPTAGLAACGK